MVKNLLLINIGVFVVASYFFPSLGDSLGLRYVEAESFRPYQILTHMFMHADIGHLFSNMFGLFMFGPMLEKLWGSNKFLIFYMVTGLGASILYSLVEAYQIHQLQEVVLAYVNNPTPDNFAEFVSQHVSWDYNRLYDAIQAFKNNPNDVNTIQDTITYVQSFYQKTINIPMVGASGALFGILMAFALLFPNIELFLIFLPIPIKAKYFVAFYGLYELYSEVMNTPGDNIAHLAHLGGMLFAYILIKMWGSNRYNSGY